MSGSVSSILSGGLPGATLGSSAGGGLAASAAQAGAATGAGSGSAAQGQLTTNYQTFLNLLMTQLQNQDPTTPMDTNQFTTELVQFSSVEQQINTNTSLTQLIQLTQSGELVQSSAMVGHTLAVANTDMPVQNGTGKIDFTATAPGQVTVAVSNSAGTLLGDSTVPVTKGPNTWSWNAVDANGNTQPDGAYKVVVTATDGAGASKVLPYDAIAKATGVVKNGSALQLQLGPVVTDFSNVQSVIS